MFGFIDYFLLGPIPDINQVIQIIMDAELPPMQAEPVVTVTGKRKAENPGLYIECMFSVNFVFI